MEKEEFLLVKLSFFSHNFFFPFIYYSDPNSIIKEDQKREEKIFLKIKIFA